MANKMVFSRLNPYILERSSAWNFSHCLSWLKKFLYTFWPPNTQMSESSVMVPIKSRDRDELYYFHERFYKNPNSFSPFEYPFISRNAHCASASEGATIQGTPNSWSSSWQSLYIWSDKEAAKRSWRPRSAIRTLFSLARRSWWRKRI